MPAYAALVVSAILALPCLAIPQTHVPLRRAVPAKLPVNYAARSAGIDPLSGNGECVAYDSDPLGGDDYAYSASSGLFSFTTYFDGGCGDTDAQTLLVNADTLDQWQCSTISTQPSYQYQTAECSIPQTDMTAGNWTVLILGNNGDDEPFAYEHHFQISSADVTGLSTPTSFTNPSPTSVSPASTASKGGFGGTTNGTGIYKPSATVQPFTGAASRVADAGSAVHVLLAILPMLWSLS